MGTTSTHIFHQFLRSSLQDTEGTFSALTDGCAKAGRDSCKLIEIIGNNATGDDVKTLVNYAHDVTGFLLEVDGPTNHVFMPGCTRALSPGIWCPRRAWLCKGYSLTFSSF